MPSRLTVHVPLSPLVVKEEDFEEGMVVVVALIPIIIIVIKVVYPIPEIYPRVIEEAV